MFHMNYLQNTKTIAKTAQTVGKSFFFLVVYLYVEAAAMKSVSRYKKSTSLTNVWPFDFCIKASLLFRCIAIYFMQLMQFITLLTF